MYAKLMNLNTIASWLAFTVTTPPGRHRPDRPLPHPSLAPVLRPTPPQRRPTLPHDRPTELDLRLYPPALPRVNSALPSPVPSGDAFAPLLADPV
jgi:hypothetical protein